MSRSSSISTKHISMGLDYSQIMLCTTRNDTRSNFFTQEGCKPYYMLRVGSWVIFSRENRVDLGWFYLFSRKINNSAFKPVDFGWINNNIKFLLKPMQIEIISTHPLVGWMWISIYKHFNLNLILFIQSLSTPKMLS